jgi:hypothetical protein
VFRVVILFFAAVLASVTVAACSSNDKQDGATATPEPGITTLYALQGKARLEGDRLIVEAEHVDWFTDRPERHAGQLTNDAFVQEWKSAGFGDVAPNAFLTGDVSDVAVVLTAVDATSTEMTFTVGETLSGATGTGDLGDIGIFIDSKNNGLIGPGH